MSVNKYLTKVDDVVMNIVDNDVIKYGFEEVFNRQIHYLNCTRISSSGLRLMQTIGAPYKYEMSKTNYLINKYSDNPDKYLNILEERHKANLKYEKDNPPIVYEKKKKTTKRTTKEKKEKVIKERKPKIDTKALKISKLNFKIKAI
mgnify:CR=1 FL=1